MILTYIRCLRTKRTKSICIAGMEGYFEGINEKTGKHRVVVYDLVGPCGPFDLSEEDFAVIGKEEFKALRRKWTAKMTSA